MLNISTDDFITLLNGVAARIVADGISTPQCFDVAQLWARVIGSSPFTGATADLIYNQPGDLYEQVPNSPTNSPVKGDLVIWNWPHVALATGNNTDSNQFEVIEQNDPTGSECHIKTYNYSGVIGWLHPKQLPQNMQALLDQCRVDRDNHWNDLQAAKATIDNLNAIIKDKDQAISSSNQQVSSLQSQVTSLTQAKDAAETVAKQVPTLQEQLTQAQNDRTTCLTAQETQNKTIAQLKVQLAQKMPIGFWNRLKFLLSL